MAGLKDFSMSFTNSKSKTLSKNKKKINIGVMGNFSGVSKGLDGIRHRIFRINIDVFDDIIAKIKPSAEVSLPNNQQLKMSFECLDDFHPDTILKKYDFESLAHSLSKFLDNLKHNKPKVEVVAVDNDESSELLDVLMSKGITVETETTEETSREPFIDKLLEDAVKSHIVYKDLKGKADKEQKEELFGILMRNILHDREFSELESLWRSISFLMENIEFDEDDYNLYLIDISKETLGKDLLEVDKLEESLIYKVLADEQSAISGVNWNLLIGNYSFGINALDINLLEQIGRLSSKLNVPLIAAAETHVPLCFDKELKLSECFNLTPELQTKWKKLRLSKDSKNIGLAFPRYLLRYPYGEKDNPIDSFNFEELGSKPEQEDFLWGNSAFLCACILGSNIFNCNWNAVLGRMIKINDLPMVIIDAKEENVIVPTAEAWITDRKLDEIQALGLSAIVPIRNDNAVYVNFQTLYSHTPSFKI